MYQIRPQRIASWSRSILQPAVSFTAWRFREARNAGVPPASSGGVSPPVALCRGLRNNAPRRCWNSQPRKDALHAPNTTQTPNFEPLLDCNHITLTVVRIDTAVINVESA